MKERTLLAAFLGMDVVGGDLFHRWEIVWLIHFGTWGGRYYRTYIVKVLSGRESRNYKAIRW